jgi:ppGpp synthetase/RelA/SpoT-type nucleotidyltranferase
MAVLASRCLTTSRMSRAIGDVMATAESLDELRVRQDANRPQFELLVERLVPRLRREIGLRGVSAVTVSGRVKDTPSLVKKAIRKSYPDPWRDIHDKVGLRVTAVFEADLENIEAAVRDVFAVTHFEDKRKALDPTTFDYLGLHFEVVVPEDVVPECIVHDCEIQVRTSAQSLWADVSHDLFYKAPVTVSSDARRSLHRLMAIVELFDLEVGRIRERIMSEPDFWTGELIDVLERDFLGLTGQPFDPQLSRMIVDNLRSTLPDGPAQDYLSTLDSFVSFNRAKLTNIYADYLTDDRHPLLSQPESLLIFERLASDRFQLRNTWPAFLPMAFLESMADIWGVPLASGDDG